MSDNQLLKNKSINFDDVSKILKILDIIKISKPIMTTYEYNQIIGLRTIQLAQGAINFIPINHTIKSNMDLRITAIEELKQGKLPFIIKRPLPNNKFEYFRVRDLDLIKVKYMMNN